MVFCRFICIFTAGNETKTLMTMNRYLVLSVGVAMLLSACTTSTGASAYSGAWLGSILGSAIGGISGGPRGSDIGTVVGTAGGAIVGAVVSNAAEKAQQEKYREYQEQREARYSRGYIEREYGDAAVAQDDSGVDNGGFDPTNSGDDRIEMEPLSGGVPNDTTAYSTVKPQTFTPSVSVSVEQLASAAPGYSFKYNSLMALRNVSFVDANGDGVIQAGEVCKVTFEIMNRSDVTLYDVQPIVLETTGNRYIHVSPSLHIESIAPHKGVRYTATVAAENRLKDGHVVLRVAVAQGDKEITSQVKEFTVATQHR